VAVAANLSAVALGTETDGSIVCPAAANSIVGLKPTVGLTSRAGVIPISHTQDSRRAGARSPMRQPSSGRWSARIPAIRHRGERGAAGRRLRLFLDPDGLRARIGIPRDVFFGGTRTATPSPNRPSTLRAAGATIIDPPTSRRPPFWSGRQLR
jgi:amidase